MEVLIFALAVVFALAVLDGLAASLGVDSREMSDDPRRPAYPVVLS